MAPPENQTAAPTGIGNGGKGRRLRETSSSTSSPPRKSRQARWAEENPLAKWAHAATRSALKSGLIKKGPCEECGSTENVDLHHARWDRPLEVVALCRRHHRQLHARLDRAKGGGDG